MPWSSFSECWALSPLFHSPLSLSSRGSSVPLHVLHTLLHLKCIADKDPLCSIGSSTRFWCASLYEKGKWKKSWYACWVAQPWLTLCSLMDCSLPGSSVLGDSSGRNAGVHFHCLFQYEKRNWKKKRMDVHMRVTESLLYTPEINNVVNQFYSNKIR